MHEVPARPARTPGCGRERFGERWSRPGRPGSSWAGSARTRPPAREGSPWDCSTGSSADGRSSSTRRPRTSGGYGARLRRRLRGGPGHGGEALPDQQAIERYRYLLRTAPPEQIEQAHAEAFEKLTVDQRQQVLAQLAAAVPAGERPRTDDPATLARVATRAEVRQPGTLERALGGYGPGYGQGRLRARAATGRAATAGAVTAAATAGRGWAA